jgi:site-specific recombinase XerD
MNDDKFEQNRPSLPAVLADTDVSAIADSAPVPVLIANEGAHASRRYIDFFTANIRNPNTRRAYIRACETFLAWCEQRNRTLATIRPFDVSTYVEGLTLTHSAPTVKQQLAAIRMLFDWLITGQVEVG